MSISLNGQNSFQVGKNVSQFAVNPNGAISLSGRRVRRHRPRQYPEQAQNDLLVAQNNNLFETAFAGLTSNAVATARCSRRF